MFFFKLWGGHDTPYTPGSASDPNLRESKLAKRNACHMQNRKNLHTRLQILPNASLEPNQAKCHGSINKHVVSIKWQWSIN